MRKQFTGYERDYESELDYAQARYYSNQHGRFTTVDAGPNTPADPQSHNRYPYVQNNPLKFRDPSGNTLTLTGSDANELVEELEKKTGYKLVRDEKSGKVTIDKSQKREKEGTSKKLAGLLKKIVGDKKTDVAIDVGKNQPGVFYDSFSQRKLDMADHQAINAVAPEFAADSLGHVLKEYYTAEKKYAGKSDSESFPPSHREGLKFESKVLSDFTGTKEKTAVESQPAPRTIRFTYTSVYYDILLKSGVPGGAIDTVEKVTKVEIKRP